MNPLPERRKSAAEIARLREAIGVPQGGGAGAEGLPGPRLSPPPGPEDHPSGGLSSAPAARDLRTSPIAAKAVLSPGKQDRHPTGAATPGDALPPSDAAAKIPVRKHSVKELEAIRRTQALAAMQSPLVDPRLATAHPVILAPGYLLALAGATCHLSDSFPAAATAGSALAGLLIAALVYWKFPSSRHHAAFMAVTALFVLVFGSLHFLPQFRHAP